ncbi:DUF4197 domain-containing protein [Hymenobacter sp. GOD-10R]|uniref:DUF4197 domain-containing protein n=1 Tax=Hymenobacter sp. GOD-10R TaxID=3093922 RepID=UPI002D79E34A|nr:DUF4197 domain-containing protein [Hymenobacter sp. GOD-10R]WRQ30470.1 DUF4197 domain-containing protein [Hymenobacter sp. GOD-10R]
MPAFRTLLIAAALGLASAYTASAQTKTTTAKAKTTTKAKATTTKKTTAKTATKTTAKTTTTKAATPAPAPAPVVKAPLTDAEASSGMKETLVQSVTNSVEQASQADGFNGNADIRIPFPPEAEMVSATLRKLRMGALVDNFEVALNRSAETASAQAKPIFLNAIQNLSFADAMSIVTSKEDDAATTYLYNKTADQLKTALQPIIQQSLQQTGATKLYAEMASKYNKIPMVTPLTKELEPYATQKTVDGLFTLIAEQEGKIRTNPAAAGSEILKRVFGK